MDKFFSTAIDLIADPETDFRKICIELAKSNPKALCEAAGMNVYWRKEALRILNKEGGVPAIKYVRQELGTSLKEAKDLVDSLAREGE